MKRVGCLYQKVYDLDNLRLAHKNARKGKGWYSEVLEVNSDEDKYLKMIQESLIEKTYNTSEYTVFTKVEINKVREIFKLPYYPDRITQWALLQVIEPYLTRTLTTDTYSAIPERGIHLALERLKTCVRVDPVGTKYCLKLDVRKYYPSIDHAVLKKIFRRIFKDDELLWLIDEIIDSTEGDKGIPIGNYMSQWCGNLYLSSFDHWIKEEKGIKYYFRYMDDLVILHESKEFLHSLKRDIEHYLESQLKLTVKDNWQVFPVEVRGIDFLGYRVFPSYTLLRKHTCKRMKKKIVYMWSNIESTGGLTHNQWCSFNSYKGWLIPCDSYRLTEKYIIPLEPYAAKFYKEVILNGKVHKSTGDSRLRSVA